MLRRSWSRLSKPTVVDRVERAGQTVSTLSNGLKVLSFDHGGFSSSLGFFSFNGSALEEGKYLGSTAVLECAMLKGNKAFDQQQFAVTLESLGNSMRFLNGREFTCQIMHVPRYDVEKGLNVLQSAALQPIRNETTFNAAKATARERLGLLSRDATRCTFELCYQAAWQGSPLGKNEYPEEATLEKVTFDDVIDFHRVHTRPERSCVVGTGINNHEAFVELVGNQFQFPQVSTPVPPLPKSKFVGTSRLVHETEAPESVRKFEERALTHMMFFFKGATMDDPDYFATSVIQMLLGGGTSFSSGGPGKGMHTKLFREVINREAWIHGIECVTAWHRDCGGVGLYGQCPHQFNEKLLKTMLAQAVTIPERVNEQHWEMAKNQLMSQLILLGETRDIQVEEAGKMMLNHGKFLVAEDLERGAENLTLDDLRRVCDRMMQEDPVTFVVYGNTKKLPDHKTICDRIHVAHKRAVAARGEAKK